jgi:RNA polymerase sigma-70 factor (ECF subfamily)
MTVAASSRRAATDESDAVVIGRALRHPEEFATLFDRHYRRIYAYAARRLGASMADDVAAETFLIAFDRRDSYDLARADAGPWLYGIAANLIARHARAEARQLRALARTGAVDVVGGDADMIAGRLDAAAVRGRLAEALTRLPATEREVLLLVAWAELSCQEVATALDIPAGTVRSRLHRARTQMRRALGMTNPILMTEDDD